MTHPAGPRDGSNAPDTLTVLTPCPPWLWAGGDGGPDLEAAVALLVEEELAEHRAERAGEPELQDTITAAEGRTFVWTVPVLHAADCPCFY